MIGVFGGAVLPLAQGFLADILGGWKMTWLAVVFCELFMLYYAVRGSRVRQSAE